jgi:hypothetical protein
MIPELEGDALMSANIARRIEDLERRARELGVEDGRRIRCLNACADARNWLDNVGRAIDEAAHALIVQFDLQAG